LAQSRSRTAKASPVVSLVKPAKVVEMYSAGVKMALVARGEADVYVNTYANFRDWDVCAGQILVEEAGGRVTDLRGAELIYGRPGNHQRGGMIASNGLLHAATVEKCAGL